MFEKIERTAVAEFDLCAEGPVLVSSGYNSELDPRLPDNTFLTGRDGKEITFVIPGSTIKGVIRNYVYKQIKNGAAVDEEELFGRIKGKAQKSKISFHDAYADMTTVVSRIRYSTAIDPILQSAMRGTLNNMQVVEKGVFKAGFKLVNYTNEELDIVIRALEAVNTKMIRFGGKTSRGFGVMKIENFKMETDEGFNEQLERKNVSVFASLEECVRGCDNGICAQ